MTGLAARRGFLRALCTLPLIGGGVTLIGRPAAPVPIVEAIGAPMLGDPRQRARYAWTAFSAAMREMTAADDGWIIECAGERRAIGRYAGHDPFMRLASVHYHYGTAPDCPNLIVERHRDIRPLT